MLNSPSNGPGDLALTISRLDENIEFAALDPGIVIESLFDIPTKT
jgi:hypothetical protein